MIEATCTACGNVNRVDEANLPVGARFVSCSTCKSRVVLPARAAGVPPIPKMPPPIPKVPPVPPIAKADPGIGLADLPAPKRASPLGEVPPPRPAPPRSVLAPSSLDADLPAPRARAPVPSNSMPIDFDLGPGGDPGEVDLPAPRGAPVRPHTPTSDLGLDLPAPKGARPAVPDAPVQSKARAITDLPIPPDRGGNDFDDDFSDDLDLPAPKQDPLADLPAPKRGADLADLPMPKAGAGIIDLPAPKPGGIADLPAPKGPRHDNLPTPKAGGGILDLPTPKTGPGDLPAPKGFFEDLPQPSNRSGGAGDLPAPKGFFDDLPQPGRAGGGSELPAPKGFFDDLPGRAKSQSAPPASKGFFDDIAPKGPPAGGGGFFDDLPKPVALGGGAGPSNAPLDLTMEDGPGLELALEEPQHSNAGIPASTKYDELDLSKPSTPAALAAPPPGPSAGAEQGIKIGTPKRPPGGSAAPPLTGMSLAPNAPLQLELAEPRKAAEAPSQRLAPKRDQPAVEKSSRPASRGRLIALAGVLVLALGGGGFLLYQRLASKPAGMDVDAELTKARASLAATDKDHWDRAAGAARRILEQDDKHPEALAIGAEALLASALSNGVAGPTKLAQARKMIATAVAENVGGAPLARAQALSAIASGTGDPAVDRLKGLVEANPKDATLQLYMGWAQAARGDHAAAIKAFDQADQLGAEAIKLYAILGRAQAKLAQLDLPGARKDFEAVYALDKTHIGAQVGLAASLPVAQSQQQEDELRAILERKDLAEGDPRAVRLAWTLAAESAKRGNRIDAARERFRKALELDPNDVRALAGLAETEMLDGKLDVAAAEIQKALNLAKDDIRAQLVQAELSIKQKNLRDAATRIEVLAARTPPPPASDQARIKLVTGKLLDAQGEDEAAAKAYEEAAKLAGDSDLAPTLAAVNKLTKLADDAEKAAEPDKATELRGRADQLLAGLEANADKDPQLALTVGMSYLQVESPEKAEPWLRKVVDARPKDSEAQYQLAKALALLNKPEEAIERLGRAIDLAPQRTEIGIELALTYERAGRDADAKRTYEKMLQASKDPSVELRARAGRFYARTGDIKSAAEQGDEILKVAPKHTVGLYLKGEGLMATEAFEEARALFAKAVDAERDPAYLDALGRATEAMARKDNDGRLQDSAIKAYEEAAKLDPTLFNPNAGLGRIYIARNEMEKAVKPLAAAYGIKKDAEVAYHMGVAYKAVGQSKAAIDWLVESIKVQPTADAAWVLGQLYNDTNQGKAAAGALDTACRLALEYRKQTSKKKPWYLDALFLRGRVHLDNGNLRAAKDAWSEYVGEGPPQSTQLKEALRHLGTTLKDA